VNIYRVKDVAKKLGISKQTLIRYEKKGVFPHSHRNRINHWREYTEDDIQKMARIIGRGSPGFTLIEIIMVIVIVSILMAVAVPRFQAFNTVKLNGAVKKIVSDIRYAQQLSLATHDTYRLSFDPSADKYGVLRANDSQYAKDPFSRKDFLVDLKNDKRYGGVDISSASFGGTTGLQFTWDGLVQNTNGANLTSEGSTVISYKGQSMTIYVRPLTGTVRVQ